MHIKQFKEITTLSQNKATDFYTPSGLHVFFSKPVEQDINVEKVISKVEETIPQHLRQEVEAIIVGELPEFEDMDFNAVYEGGTIYVTHLQDDEDDMVDDIVHEFAHSVEEPHGFFIYGDSRVKDEFLNKRMNLHKILWASGYKAPKSFFTNIDYDKELDDFLYKTVGYDKLARLLTGVFVSTYAPTSLREYFATGFTEFFLFPDRHEYLRKVSPELFKKISQLYFEEDLDI